MGYLRFEKIHRENKHTSIVNAKKFFGLLFILKNENVVHEFVNRIDIENYFFSSLNYLITHK